MSLLGSNLPRPTSLDAGVSSPSIMDDAKRAGFQPGAPLVALLTGGGDKPYALGISDALAGEKIRFDFIGSDDLQVPEVLRNPFARFLNLRGDQNPKASRLRKFWRLFSYYCRLLGYAVVSQAPIFHILWHNKIQWLDRTLVLLFYKILGKRLVYTAHNVNTEARDGKDSAWNRATLRWQYKLVDHVFVHTQKMKAEITASFGVPGGKISVIPFGINATNPSTGLSCADARARFQLRPEHKVLLFFGNVAEYKGLDVLLKSFAELLRRVPEYRLIVAGRIKCAPAYYESIKTALRGLPNPDAVIQRIEYIPDDQVEVFFKAADVLVLPYREIFQSGVLFLGYNFGLPVIVADVGSLKEEIVEGETGFAFKPEDSADLTGVVRRFFSSPLYHQRSLNRSKIRAYAHDRYSWSKVAKITISAYSALLRKSSETEEAATAPANRPAIGVTSSNPV